MKTPLSFLLLFLFLLGFGQKKEQKPSYEEIECDRYVKQLEERNKILKKEARKINFKKINKLIFKEILSNEFSKDDIIIIIEKYREQRGPCILNPKILYPIYTEKEFWNKKNISKFSKKLNKKIKIQTISSIEDTKIDNKTTNSLCLQFTTLKEKKVLVKYIIDKNKNYYKTYQYQNKKWVEIPTTDEYKF